MASANTRLSRVRRLACLVIKGALCTTAADALDALTCLPALNVVVQVEARSTAHQLWSL